MEKIAIIDIESSKIDFFIVHYNQNGNFTVTEEMSEPIRIIEDLDGDGMLKSSRSNEALSILKMYKVLCDVNKITNIVAYMSNSIKNLKNYRSFIEEIYNSIGIKAKLLSPEEEISALYSGIINAIDMPKGVVVMICGASTKLLQYNRRNILNQAVLPIGTYEIARLMEGVSSTEAACEIMTNRFKEELLKIEWLKTIDQEEYGFIGTGNAFLNVGALSRKIRKYPVELAHNYVLSNESFHSVYDLVKTLEIDKTKKIKGVSNDRADIFASGVCMIKALFEILCQDNCVISTKGIKEGFICSNVSNYLSDRPIADLLGFSLDNIESYYDGEDMVNAKQVGNLALILFRQLKVLHKLPRNYIKVLRIASILHDCGRRIRFADHEKNSFNVVLNSDLLGVSHREIILAAFVCASQNLNDFSLAEWIKYKELLLDEDLEAMRKLAVIVKLAEALDKTKRSVVQDVSCDILGDSVIMKTIITMEASIEIREALKSAQDFKKVYKKSLEVL